MSESGQTNASSDPSPSASAVGERLSALAGRVALAAQGGWREAAIPAAQAYLITLAVSLLTLGAAALIAADDLDGGGLLLAFKVALAGVAMSFRGALVLGGDSADEGLPGGDLTVVAPPLMLAVVAVAALALCSRRRRAAGTARDAARVAIWFAAAVGAGAFLVRTTRDLLSLGDLTVRVALPGTVFWALVVAFASVWLAFPGRTRSLGEQVDGSRFGPWRVPVLAGAVTVGAILAAAMVAGGLYGAFRVATEDGLGGGDRLSLLLAGFTYLPVVGAFGIGIAGGANLVGPDQLGFDRLVFGWFGETQPSFWWAFATVALLTLAVAGAVWLVQRQAAPGCPWRGGFITGFAGAWIALALVSQFVIKPDGSSMMAFGLGTLGAIVTGVAIGTLATFAAEMVPDRFRRLRFSAPPVEEHKAA